MNRAPSLYQLQSQWDQDGADARFAPFRAGIRAAARADLRAASYTVPLLVAALLGITAMAGAFA